jgi:hypothetical protein
MIKSLRLAGTPELACYSLVFFFNGVDLSFGSQANAQALRRF